VRRITNNFKIGNIGIGSNYPVSIQTMTNTKTYDVDSTVKQIIELNKAGADIVRIAVPTDKDANAIKNIVKRTKNIPLVADIHFRVKYAIKAIESGINAIRINPGNMPNKDLETLIDSAKQNNVPIRIGVNAGSIHAKLRPTFLLNPIEALVQSALSEASIFEKNNFYDFKISIKHHTPMVVVNAYEELAKHGNWPFHIGVTEAGLFLQGVVKNTSAMSILLNKGIGDTIRVSLSDDPIKEVEAGLEILYSLGIRKRPFEIISCPTCGRTEIDLISLTEKVKQAVIDNNIKLKVAVMGCIVNGPGEAKDADIGVAAGPKQGQIFIKGKPIKTVQENEILPELIKAANKLKLV
jgi:(E)-4-hydroxy-3-methylbut-2-enyl-diphosphate synthase